jgi:hypothetical protein
MLIDKEVNAIVIHLKFVTYSIIMYTKIYHHLYIHFDHMKIHELHKGILKLSL